VKRLWSILFWSVISAAFIGPGTVTTAASAGAGYGFALLWSLVFSTVACLVLQEAAARLTVVSGRNLGQALRMQYRHGLSGVAVLVLVLGAIVLGCAAYEAGNILGGAAGAALGTSLSTRTLTLFIGAAAAFVLLLGRTAVLARMLGVLVAVMGIAFLVTAWRLEPQPIGVIRGAFVPTVPSGAGLLVLGLVGTTVVPYNLFLGSGLARGQALRDLRFGLTVAVVLGGIVSMGIVVVGTAVEGAFSFESLAMVLAERLGDGARHFFAIGLCAAGVSSAITAPLAAAITARSLFSSGASGRTDGVGRQAPWEDRGWKFRSVWSGVLAVGVVFGLADVKPIPAIIVAQALNGVLLPLVAVFLLLCVNDRRLMKGDGLNGAVANGVLGAVVGVAVMLGVNNVVKALVATFGLEPPGEGRLLFWSVCLALAGVFPVWRRARRLRRKPQVENRAAEGQSPD
jgi:Mn2+/Fe2+ NRAMP family transporter